MAVKELTSIDSVRRISSKEYNVRAVNSIAHLKKKFRQDSKAPTFALTYQGTSYTLMKNCGFTQVEADNIVTRFHDLYKQSALWIEKELELCCERGYATVAFGLRIRTPLLGKSVLNNAATAKISAAEARSVGNAISGQSYGLLNNRAAVAFMQKVWDSPYAYDIMPVSLIHDAIYLMIKNTPEVVKWVNDNLIEEMQWQDLPELQHDQVKLGAELDVFFPNWAKPVTIPNSLSEEEIKAHVKKHRTSKTV